jgi:hypothetical protein
LEQQKENEQRVKILKVAENEPSPLSPWFLKNVFEKKNETKSCHKSNNKKVPSTEII